MKKRPSYSTKWPSPKVAFGIAGAVLALLGAAALVAPDEPLAHQAAAAVSVHGSGGGLSGRLDMCGGGACPSKAASTREPSKAAPTKSASDDKKAQKPVKKPVAAPDSKTGPVPTSCNRYKGNRRTGCTLLLRRGFGISQMSCLDKLWTKESGWNHKAKNRSSGAYGIPQSLPAKKMASAGSDWRNNPITQINWGLGYIKKRYGTPCRAWQHSQRTNWY